MTMNSYFADAAEEEERPRQPLASAPRMEVTQLPGISQPSSPYLATRVGIEEEETAITSARFCTLLAKVANGGVGMRAIDVTLGSYRSILAVRPVGQVDRLISILIQLAAVRLAAFEIWKDEVEQAPAESLLHEVMDLSPADSLESRATTFMLRLPVRRRVDLVRVDGQSSVEQDSVPCLADEDLQVSSYPFLDRFERFGDLADLQRAIAILKELVESTPPWDNQYYSRLENFGTALLYRFKHFAELSDLEDAILMLGDAANPRHGHLDKLRSLNNLGTALRFRFQRLGVLSDLERAISTFRDAIYLAPHGHPVMPAILNNLGDSLLVRFQCLGALDDLEDAISSHRDALYLIPHAHARKTTCLSSLGVSLMVRFECFGKLSDIEDSILNHKNAINLTPNGQLDKPVYLNNLGLSFFTRFQHSGELTDLEDALSALRNALHLTPDGHPDKPARLTNLGNFLKTRFERFEELSDLENAISRQANAVDLTPHDHPDKPGRLDSLGNSVATRFQHLRELSDLEVAIAWQKDAVSLTPDDHPDRLLRLNNLGTSLFHRFQHFCDQNDIKDAISMFQQTVDLAPNGHPSKSICLNNLGASLQACFDRFGDLNALERAVSTFRDAVKLIPGGHASLPVHLKNTGCSLLARFEGLGELNDIEDAISRLMDAVDRTPHGHPDRPDFLDNLGDSFVARFEELGELPDLERAISAYSHAATANIGPVSVRVLTSQKWMSHARRIGHRSLFRACRVAISLLPQLAWIGLSFVHRYAELALGADVVREAAAIALDLGRPETAVEWLEQGRSIVWGELFQLRSSHEELSSRYPDHARRLRELSTELENASTTRETSLSTQSKAASPSRATGSLERQAVRHRALAIERDKLLREIRQLPGFEQFLLHREFSCLRASAHPGPVVILNAAKSRCDALIVLANMEHAIHVPLPNFSCKRSVDLQNTLKGFLRQAREGKSAAWDDVSWDSFLSPLWKCVVKPVLDALALSVGHITESLRLTPNHPKQSPGDLSRIFWCPTGPFAFLPIHAAGFYDSKYSQPGHKVFDFVVSSYVPSLSILALSSDPNMSPSSDLRLLVVRQPPTDRQSQLPGVAIELGYIKDIIENSPSSRTTLLESSVGTVEEVFALMKESDWVHFACHGIQDGVNSGLCLADGRRLNLREITALSRPNGGLAFLSACQTATGEERLSDEAIHVAAGMLFAGYGGVVGTTWSISDRLAPDVARDVYTHLFRNGATRPDYREAARALHNAIGRLRDEGGASFDEWIPFVHVGL